MIAHVVVFRTAKLQKREKSLGVVVRKSSAISRHFYLGSITDGGVKKITGFNFGWQGKIYLFSNYLLRRPTSTFDKEPVSYKIRRST